MTPSHDKPRRQQWSAGAVVRVPLGEHHTYAWMLAEKCQWAFLDARSAVPLAVGEVARRPVLFRLCVMRSAYGGGRWAKVGAAPLPPELLRPAERFMYDRIAQTYGITTDGGATRRPATVEECRPLECCAVWSAAHVEDRLRDHYAGVPNKWAAALRPPGMDAGAV